ncbi:hypothetical protein CMQ_4262 [Grosmannia clavigera kw1407]|uniref:Uncharacterized protein n=1 Tax=Grosmannia clavigera (strain kw1407 / UAMH 11150) TaxID=655863 RepID=F0XUY5_GROCL|nr:uncharacterized protein CMQ_4262 [Grosmannia clavigera kw1407]EFW98410.1 hypothetical protein CMQ_4262 [Grosmannia clavigera kw1407]
MGGAAFSSGPDPLNTPRMSPAVYEAVRERCHRVLREVFVAVATPIEGPGKTDYGDVDVLVAVGREPDSEGDEGRLREAVRRLGAERAIHVPSKATVALPWPEREEDEAAIRHVQVDLAVLPSLAALQWALFKHAHGDFWNVLGTVLRPLGLTIDETALWLRVPEIEQANRRRARVFLSSDPAEVLHFLGLPVLGGGGEEKGSEGGESSSETEETQRTQRTKSTRGSDPDGPLSLWERPFADADSMFAYAVRSRFFVLPPDDNTIGTDDTHTSLPGRSKANDRRRLRYRPVFRQWATDFVPAYRRRLAVEAVETSSPTPTRASVRDAAFARFADAGCRYHHTRTAWLAERRAVDVWAAAKAAVPASLPGRYRSAACAAIRRRLDEGPDPDTVPDMTTNDALEGMTGLAAWTVDQAVAFVTTHWQTLAAEVAPEEHTHYLSASKAED